MLILKKYNLKLKRNGGRFSTTRLRPWPRLKRWVRWRRKWGWRRGWPQSRRWRSRQWINDAYARGLRRKSIDAYDVAGWDDRRTNEAH